MISSNVLDDDEEVNGYVNPDEVVDVPESVVPVDDNDNPEIVVPGRMTLLNEDWDRLEQMHDEVSNILTVTATWPTVVADSKYIEKLIKDAENIMMVTACLKSELETNLRSMSIDVGFKDRAEQQMTDIATWYEEVKTYMEKLKAGKKIKTVRRTASDEPTEKNSQAASSHQ